MSKLENINLLVFVKKCTLSKMVKYAGKLQFMETDGRGNAKVYIISAVCLTIHKRIETESIIYNDTLFKFYLLINIQKLSTYIYQKCF